MGSRKTYEGADEVYKAAAMWVHRALRTDDSLFTPGVEIWTWRWLAVLRERFLDQPDEGEGGFYDKLRTQLKGCPPEVYQLMGEVLYVQFLFVWQGTMKAETKLDRINQVLTWPEHDIAVRHQGTHGLGPVVAGSRPSRSAAVPSDAIPCLGSGIANYGPGRSMALPYYVGFLIEFAEQWKEMGSRERDQFLAEPWAFKSFARHIEFRGELCRSRPNTHRPQLEALLHLVHPDTFEGIVSIEHKRRIATSKSFAHYITEDSGDVDHAIQQIRQGLETGLGRDLDFYDHDILSRWNPSHSSAWDAYIGLASEFLNNGLPEPDGPDFIARDEIDYKLEIARDLSVARDAVLYRTGEWQDLLKQALKSRPGHPIAWQLLGDFNKWCDENPEDALEALRGLWGKHDPEAFQPRERIEAFAYMLPDSALRGAAGNRANVISVLLMGLDAEHYPPFRVRKFEQAYEITGYDPRPVLGDEAELYGDALRFLDRFIKEARARGLPVRHRLDAQSFVWMIPSLIPEPQDDDSTGSGGEPTEDDPSPQYVPDLPALAEEVFLPVEFLENIDTLLEEKKQVIFQGPPGTGKTYVAKELAKCLAGSKDRVTLVQFHPSYAYEDFVQGFRPVAAGDGQVGFELRDGPLLRAAKLAKSESGARHFLVIDEINRGNLAKVFGELYFLLEYRDEEISLQYQQATDKKFSLPANLHIIGTMNTADRSIALVDLALRRRFYFVEFHPDDEPVKSVLHKWLAENARGMDWLADVVEDVNEKLKDNRHAAIGPSYFMQQDLDREKVERVWKHSVIPYIEECLFGDNERIGQFDLDKLKPETQAGDNPATEDGAESDSESAEPSDNA